MPNLRRWLVEEYGRIRVTTTRCQPAFSVAVPVGERRVCADSPYPWGVCHSVGHSVGALRGSDSDGLSVGAQDAPAGGEGRKGRGG